MNILKYIGIFKMFYAIENIVMLLAKVEFDGWLQFFFKNKNYERISLKPDDVIVMS